MKKILSLLVAVLFSFSAHAEIGFPPGGAGGGSGPTLPVSIANGGTGQTTAPAALNALSTGYFVDPRGYGSKCNAPNYAPTAYFVSTGGSGWVLGETFILANENAFGLHMRGAVNATGHVTSVSGGAVTGIVLDTLGDGYYAGLQGLTSTSGNGAGAFVTVTAVNAMPVAPTITIASGGNGFGVGDIVYVPNASSPGNNLTARVSSISGGGFSGPVTGLTINNPGGDYVTGTNIVAFGMNSTGHGLTINITSVTGNAANGTWDDTYGLEAAGVASATLGQTGTVVLPDQCWVQTLMPAQGSTYAGMALAANYGLSDEETSGQYINPSSGTHLFMFGTPNFAVDWNGKGSIALDAFEIRAYSLNAVNTSVAIGSYNGGGGIAGYSQLPIPYNRTYSMSAKGFKAGQGSPNGSSNCACYLDYIFVDDQNSDWGGNTYGIYGPFSDFVFSNDIIASTNGGIWITNAGGGLGRISNTRIEYTSGIGIELDGGGGFQTQLDNIQIDRASLAGVFVNNASEVTMTASIVKSGGEVGTLRVTGAANNGSGLVRLTVTGWGYCPNACGASATSGLVTGDKITVASVTGTTEANGTWTITVVDGSHIDLQASTFTNAYVSGGTGGVWNKGSNILLSGTSAYDFHAVNVGFGEETGGQNIPTAYIVESQVSSANYDYVSFEGGFAHPASYTSPTPEGAYSQSFANWQIGQPTHYVQHVPGAPWCQNGDTAFSISCTTGSTTIATLLTTTENGTIIPTTSGDTAAVLNTAQTFGKGQSGKNIAPTDTSGTWAIDLNAGQNFQIALVHGETVVISNPANIASRIGSSGVLEFTQSSTGGDTISTWGSDFKFASGTPPTLSSGANDRDYFSYFVDDSTHIMITGGVLNAH